MGRPRCGSGDYSVNSVRGAWGNSRQALWLLLTTPNQPQTRAVENGAFPGGYKGRIRPTLDGSPDAAGKLT
jgi:hypothetical protein